MIYLPPILFSFFGLLFLEKLKASSRKLIIILLLSYLTVIVSIRYMVGGDTFFYHKFFDGLVNSNSKILVLGLTYQPLFLGLMILSKTIYPSFITFQIIHALVINLTLYFFFSKRTQYVLTSIFLSLICFYWNFSVEILRESLAICLFLWSYKFVEKKNYLIYLIISGIAVLIHFSALILFIVPYIIRLRFNPLFYFILFSLGLIQFILPNIFSILNSIENLESKIAFYSTAQLSFNSTALFFIVKFIIPFGYFFVIKNFTNLKIPNEGLICFMIIAGALTINHGLLFSRLTNYVLPFYCIAIAETLQPILQKTRMSVIKFFAIIILLSIITFNGYYSFLWPTKYYVKWIPYISYFSEEAKNQEFIYR